MTRGGVFRFTCGFSAPLVRLFCEKRRVCFDHDDYQHVSSMLDLAQFDTTDAVTCWTSVGNRREEKPLARLSEPMLFSNRHDTPWSAVLVPLMPIRWVCEFIVGEQADKEFPALSCTLPYAVTVLDKEQFHRA